MLIFTRLPFLRWALTNKKQIMDKLIPFPETFGNLSPRQYIATMAMQGILASISTYSSAMGDKKMRMNERVHIAEEAALMADVLLDVLDKTKPDVR